MNYPVYAILTDISPYLTNFEKKKTRNLLKKIDTGFSIKKMIKCSQISETVKGTHKVALTKKDFNSEFIKIYGVFYLK